LGVANVLRDISQAPRHQKADLAANFLSGLKPDLVCPCVRLLWGELWPPWEDRDMDTGPEALLAALREVSDEDVLLLKDRLGEMGLVAEAALLRKGQHPLSSEPLEAVSVYQRLRHISEMSGEDSEHRKNAILRGLFLEATPLEGKYIARTALRNLLAGIGPQTMISALSSAFHCHHHDVQKAYNLMPEMGMVARAACLGKLDEAVILPKRPIKSMTVRPGKAFFEGAFQPKYAGLRVQIHKQREEILIFTSRQRDITRALNGLLPEIGGLTGDLIFDADLIGFDGRRICSQMEMLGYINRRRLSSRRQILPALLAYDLIFLDGEDLTGLAYQERRRKLLARLGEPKGVPFQGISPAEERVFKSQDEVENYLLCLRRAQGRGLVARDLGGLYLPGGCSEHDFIIGTKETLAAMVVRAEFGGSKNDKLLTRYLVALRHQDELVPVGWVSRGLGRKDAATLSDHLWSLALDQDEKGVNVRPQVILILKISGALFRENEYRILQPKIEEMRPDSALEETDELKRLEAIS